MDIAFCKVDTCEFCKEVRRKEYIHSKRHAHDRLERIIKDFTKDIVIHEKPIDWDNTDYEYQVWKDNTLSLGGL